MRVCECRHARERESFFLFMVGEQESHSVIVVCIHHLYCPCSRLASSLSLFFSTPNSLFCVVHFTHITFAGVNLMRRLT